MPVYEFLCHKCNRIFNFLVRDSRAASCRPTCPQCGGRRMSRLFSRFAAAPKGASQPKEQGAEGPADLSPEQEARMERAMVSIAKDMESVDEKDPRALASVLRRLSDASGEPVDEATDEAIRRLEAGEDPEAVEEAMGDAFPDDGSGGGPGSPSHDDGLYDV